MAFDWQNSFEGVAGSGVTVNNSALSGDPLDVVGGNATYSDEWAHVGRTSLRLEDGDASAYVAVNDFAQFRSCSVRAYIRVLSGRCVVDVRPADGDNLTWHLYADGSVTTPGRTRTNAGEFDASEFRIAVTTGSIRNTTYIYDGANIDGTERSFFYNNSSMTTPSGYISLWIFAADGGVVEVDSMALNDNASEINAADQFFSGSASASMTVGGSARGAVWDPALLSAHMRVGGSVSGAKSVAPPEVTGGIRLSGAVSGVVGDPTPLPPVDTGASLARDLWVGPLGDLRRVRRGAETDHEYELGNAQFTSLSGRVTSSRARYVPMTRSYTWERLEGDDRDWLVEVSFLSHSVSTMVEVVSPHANNLCSPEQSRGAPRAGVVGTAAVSELYSVEGTGNLTVASNGRRRVQLSGAVEGSRVVWLHSYYGALGWPCMEDWPVYFHVGEGALHDHAGMELTFYGDTGLMLGRGYAEPGASSVSARAPQGTATVSPRAVVTSVAPPDVALGSAWLLYRPIPFGSRVPLGDGCPSMTVSSFGETPAQRWTDVALELTEVTSHAIR